MEKPMNTLCWSLLVPLAPPRAPPRNSHGPPKGPLGPPWKTARPPGGVPRPPGGPKNSRKTPREGPRERFGVFQKTMYFLKKTIHFEAGRFQNRFSKCPSGFLGAPRGPRWGQGVCTITVLVPRGLHDNIIVSKRFPHPWRDPPRKPHIARNHIFPTFFHHFCFALWAQRAPSRLPLLARAPPLGPSEAPPRIATAPLGPQRAPLAAENATKVCACLLIQVSYLKTMFCHTSPVILTLFWSKWL